jgi:hypothetical protein
MADMASTLLLWLHAVQCGTHIHIEPGWDGLAGHLVINVLRVRSLLFALAGAIQRPNDLCAKATDH